MEDHLLTLQNPNDHIPCSSIPSLCMEHIQTHIVSLQHHHCGHIHIYRTHPSQTTGLDPAHHQHHTQSNRNITPDCPPGILHHPGTSVTSSDTSADPHRPHNQDRIRFAFHHATQQSITHTHAAQAAAYHSTSEITRPAPQCASRLYLRRVTHTAHLIHPDVPFPAVCVSLHLTMHITRRRTATLQPTIQPLIPLHRTTSTYQPAVSDCTPLPCHVMLHYIHHITPSTCTQLPVVGCCVWTFLSCVVHVTTPNHTHITCQHTLIVPML